jgi:hypothetical protein
LPENETVTATPTLTDFEKWAKAPAEEEVADTPAPKAAEVETAPASEPEKTAQEIEDEEEEALPKGLKKRFRKLTGKIRDLETQLASKPAAAAAPAAEVKPAAATPPATKPKAESFPTYEEFIEALTNWGADQRELKKAAAETTKRTEAAAKTQQSEWLARVAEAKERHDDWSEVVDKAVDVPITGAMQQTILEMDRGPDVVHFLASNKDEAKRISKLTPSQQARALGKIEDALDPLDDDQPEPKTPAVTKAPKPARTLTGSSGSDAGKEPDPKNFTAWSKWKDRQDKAAEPA